MSLVANLRILRIFVKAERTEFFKVCQRLLRPDTRLLDCVRVRSRSEIAIEQEYLDVVKSELLPFGNCRFSQPPHLTMLGRHIREVNLLPLRQSLFRLPYL
jgi:hypothetical protein